MQLLKLKTGEEVKLDDVDFQWLNRWKWKRHTQGYASRTGYRNGEFVHILMHREILDVPDGFHAHHINGDKRDNQRSNLTVLPAADHLRLHVGPLVALAKERQIYPDLKTCKCCGKEFIVNPRKRKRNSVCSRSCATRLAWVTRSSSRSKPTRSSRRSPR